jgi:hypothetical protein
MFIEVFRRRVFFVLSVLYKEGNTYIPFTLLA